MGRFRYRHNDCDGCFTAASLSWFPSPGIAAQHCEQCIPQCALEMSHEEQRALVCLSLCPHRNTCMWSKKTGQLCMCLAAQVCSPPRVLVDSSLQDYEEREVLEQEHEKKMKVVIVEVLKRGHVQKMKHFSIAVLVDGNGYFVVTPFVAQR